jgi:hypothetical protein
MPNTQENRGKRGCLRKEIERRKDRTREGCLMHVWQLYKDNSIKTGYIKNKLDTGEGRI